MDSQYLQQQRYQLQKRVRRLNSCPHHVFHSSLVQFWNYLASHTLFAGILTRLDAESISYEKETAQLINSQELPEFTTESEMVAFCFRVIQYCVRHEPPPGSPGLEAQIGLGFSGSRKVDDCLDFFREVLLEPFYEYLDEELDQQTAVLSLLVKYKRKVEWFERETVRELIGQGERRLATHLYGYLFDQGLDFQIEPQSASGEADLVSKEIVLDAKIFDGGARGCRYLVNGFNQVHTYAQDFNRLSGYLVVYRTCPEDINFTFASSSSLVPFLTAANKTIYIVVIDVCDHAHSASKRGALKAFSLTSDEFAKERSG